MRQTLLVAERQAKRPLCGGGGLVERKRLRYLCRIESPPDPLWFGLGVSAAARSTRHCATLLASAGRRKSHDAGVPRGAVHPWASGGLAEAVAWGRPLRAFARLPMAAPILLARVGRCKRGTPRSIYPSFARTTHEVS